MLKHGLIASPTHWQDLLAWDIYKQDIATLAPLIADSIAIKQQIVSADPHEKNIRRTLNFGHTIGHAIEAAYLQQGIQSYHGHCVLWGMVAEVYLSVVHAGCPRDVLTMLTHLMVEHYGRPQCNCQQQGLLLEWMRHDKKNHDADQLNFTLLRCIGTPIIDQSLTDKDVNEALEYLFSL